MVDELNESEGVFQTKLLYMSRMMRQHQLPPALEERVMQYYTYQYRNHQGFDNFQMLRTLPAGLRTDIMLQLTRPMIERVPFFHAVGEGFVRSLVDRLAPQIAAAGETIVRQGQLGNEMYFVHRGEFGVLVGSPPVIVAKLRQGSYFGEGLIVSKPRTATVQARTFCDLFTLTRRALNEVLVYCAPRVPPPLAPRATRTATRTQPVLRGPVRRRPETAAKMHELVAQRLEQDRAKERQASLVRKYGGKWIEALRQRQTRLALKRKQSFSRSGGGGGSGVGRASLRAVKSFAVAKSAALGDGAAGLSRGVSFRASRGDGDKGDGVSFKDGKGGGELDLDGLATDAEEQDDDDDDDDDEAADGGSGVGKSGRPSGGGGGDGARSRPSIDDQGGEASEDPSFKDPSFKDGQSSSFNTRQRASFSPGSSFSRSPSNWRSHGGLSRAASFSAGAAGLQGMGGLLRRQDSTGLRRADHRSRTPWHLRAIGVARARSREDYFVVVLPHGGLRRLWLVLLLLAVVWNLFLVPYSIAFVWGHHKLTHGAAARPPLSAFGWLLAPDYLADAVFALDLLLCQRLAFVDDQGILIKDARAIGRRWRRAHLLHAVLAVLPADVLLLLCGAGWTPVLWLNRLLHAAKVFRVPPELLQSFAGRGEGAARQGVALRSAAHLPPRHHLPDHRALRRVLVDARRRLRHAARADLVRARGRVARAARPRHQRAPAALPARPLLRHLEPHRPRPRHQAGDGRRAHFHPRGLVRRHLRLRVHHRHRRRPGCTCGALVPRP